MKYLKAYTEAWARHLKLQIFKNQVYKCKGNKRPNKNNRK